MDGTDVPKGPGGGPLAPLEKLSQWALGASARLLLGLLIGGFAARLMRERHLHWSWAAGGIALWFLARTLLGGAGVVVLAASLGALFTGRRWHREDLATGVDLARVAAARRRPLAAVAGLLHALVRSRRTRHNGEGWFDGERLLVGRDRDGRSVAIPFGGGRGGAHTLLLGATGSGKTVSQTWICVRAIESGRAAIVIDPKGDGDLRTALRAAARAARRRYIEWTPSGPSRYNPYARGSDSAIADRVLAGERFTEPHYQRQAQRYLGHEVRILRRARVPLCLASIVEHLEPERLEQLARTLPEHQAATTHCYLDSLSARQRTDLAGVRDRLAILAESDVGEWLRPGKSFDVLDAVRSRAVVYFDLEADARPLLAQMLGRAVVQDLQSAIAAQQEQPVPAVVALDEFSALGLEQVVGLFARARSAGFSMVLGTQELADLRVGRERVLEQVLGNLSTVIVHRQVLPDSAALVTSLAGTRGAWRGARHSDGRITRTRTSEPVLRADEVMALPAGWAAVIALTDASGAHVTRMFSTRAV